MAAGVKFTGGGKLLTKLKKMAKNSTKSRLTAGFYKNATYEDGTPVAQVAAINNFGTVQNGGFIPPRPFFNQAINENKDKWAEHYGQALKRTDYDIERSAKLVGEEMQTDIVDSINDWTEPSNAPSTVSKKGRNSPLKDTYHMMRSVGYQYNDESPQYSQGGD